MSTVAGGPPAEAPSPEQNDPTGAQADGQTPAAAGRTCSKCGSPLAPGQDWCLECGAAAPGALGPPMWRSTGAVFAVLGALAIGAAAAAVAALNQNTPAPKTVSIVAQTTPPATPPAATPPPAAPPPQASKQSVQPNPSKLPKIPLTASTPTATTPPVSTNTTPSSNSGSSGSSGTSGGETEVSGGGSEGSGSEGASSTPSAMVLDTDAASTYNPYSYPASYFGDPSLTIDGDHSTAWTAEVDPTNAPAMAEGMLIDLKSPQHLGALELFSSSKGMVVQVYGSAANKVPASITEKEWVPLGAPLKLSKTKTHFKLRKPKQSFRWITVWISRAPAAAVGTQTAPGHVGIGEIELFPPS